jgi:hypothetical protein
MLVEDVYRTEGIPEFTFVEPPNYTEILVDIRSATKPVIIEGQSGTGKTTVVKKILGNCFASNQFSYLTPRIPKDLIKIETLASGIPKGIYIIDDFHRLDNKIQTKIGNLIKISAEGNSREKYPKIIIVGINKVGSQLIYLVHDIAKRCGIHKIKPAALETTLELIGKGEEKLNIKINEREKIYEETKGDYWLTQLLCRTACIMNGITETAGQGVEFGLNILELRKNVTERLSNNYRNVVRDFCKGNRFRSTNDPYFKLLRCVSKQESSIVDLEDLPIHYPEVRGSINKIKQDRLSTLIASKEVCAQYFYYNQDTKNFAIEDPALFYYLKNIDWEEMRHYCGFKGGGKEYEWDFAISFAGENRDLAREIACQLKLLDCSIFFDEFYETNYLGQAWREHFKVIFSEKSRFVVCLLDENHQRKIWPTFERETFEPRVSEGAVIPIFLDDTKFPGISRDVIGIILKREAMEKDMKGYVTDEIAFKLHEKLSQI